MRKPSKMEQKLATHWGKQHHKLKLNIQYRQARATLKVNEDNIYLFNTHRIQNQKPNENKNEKPKNRNRTKQIFSQACAALAKRNFAKFYTNQF